MPERKRFFSIEVFPNQTHWIATRVTQISGLGSCLAYVLMFVILTEGTSLDILGTEDSSVPRMSSDVPECAWMFPNVEGVSLLSCDPACGLPTLRSNHLHTLKSEHCTLSSMNTAHSQVWTLHTLQVHTEHNTVQNPLTVQLVIHYTSNTHHTHHAWYIQTNCLRQSSIIERNY